MQLVVIRRSAQDDDQRYTPALRLRGPEMIFRVGGLDLIGKAAVLKTAARKRFGVRVPGPPLALFHNELRDLRRWRNRRRRVGAWHVSRHLCLPLKNNSHNESTRVEITVMAEISAAIQTAKALGNLAKALRAFG